MIRSHDQRPNAVHAKGAKVHAKSAKEFKTEEQKNIEQNN
jgi:hypothetical protein